VVTTLPVATFSYTGSPYCSNAANLHLVEEEWLVCLLLLQV
jgi:hypothetical protein